MKCRWTAFVLVLCMVAAVMVPAAAEDLSAAPAQSQIERIVVSYADSGTRDDRALEALSVLDPSLSCERVGTAGLGRN